MHETCIFPVIEVPHPFDVPAFMKIGELLEIQPSVGILSRFHESFVFHMDSLNVICSLIHDGFRVTICKYRFDAFHNRERCVECMDGTVKVHVGKLFWVLSYK